MKPGDTFTHNGITWTIYKLHSSMHAKPGEYDWIFAERYIDKNRVRRDFSTEQIKSKLIKEIHHGR